MSEPDLLFNLRNHFYLGAYQAAIAEASDLEGLSEAQRIERDVFVYRAYIELGSYDLVMNEVTNSSPMALQAVKLLAQYQSKKMDKETALGTLSEWLKDPAANGNAHVLLIAGIVYSSENDYVEALRAVSTGATLENMEMMALSVQVLLSIDRVDQAEKVVKQMSTIDDDATLAQLATAWLGLYLGGAKVQEASYIFQELSAKFNWTVRLYNGLAVCQMRMGQWEDAEKELLEAFEKDAKSPDTLANLVTVGLHLGKNVSRYDNQLKALAPSHLQCKRIQKAEEDFERASAGFTSTA